MRWRTIARELTLNVLPVIAALLWSELNGRLRRLDDTALERRMGQPSQSSIARLEEQQRTLGSERQ